MSKFVRHPPDVFEDAMLDAGGKVDEYHICLGYYGDELNPDKLSALLGRKPTSSSLKGDLVNKNERTRIEKTGKWILSARETPGARLKPQIADLLASMTADLSVWRSLAKRFRVRFVVGAWIRSWNRGALKSRPDCYECCPTGTWGLGSTSMSTMTKVPHTRSLASPVRTMAFLRQIRRPSHAPTTRDQTESFCQFCLAGSTD